MKLRNANYQDLRQIVLVHEMCFPNNFSTQLGNKLLCRLYKEYLDVNSDLFLVGVDGNQIVGFCMG